MQRLLKTQFLALKLICSVLLVLALLFLNTQSFAAEDLPRIKTKRLITLSLEELMSVNVVSANKTSQALANIPAAVFVISADDIKQAGTNYLPELLRMVPGVQVARAGPWTWAVNMRDSNNIYSDKLLMMIDGQTMYNHLFAGTMWGDQNLFLEDVERIEVIRGSGGTMWGANAVNGVINIINKSAKETQGGLLVAGGGLEEEGFIRARYGMKPSENSALRVYGNLTKVDSAQNLEGQDNEDNWHGKRGGLRFDSDLNAQDKLMLQAEAYDIKPRVAGVETILQPPYQRINNDPQSSDGHNLLGRWNRKQSQEQSWQIQAFYNYTHQDFGTIAHQHRVFDLDFQHNIHWDDRHELLWGGGYRYIQDSYDNTLSRGLLPSASHYSVSNLFIQDDITLVPEQWRMIVGSKFEYHDFTGLAIQPSLRLLWTPNPRNTLWLAASRAVQMLARERFDLYVLQLVTILPDGSPLMLHGSGYDDLQPSKTISQELGWRTVAAENLTLDSTLFYSKTRDIIGISEFTGPTLDPRGFNVLKSHYTNNLDSKQYGFETALTWQARDWWQWQASFTALNIVNNKGDSPLKSPHYRASLHSHMSLGKDWSLDGWLYHSGKTQSSTNVLSAYTRVDLRLAWQLNYNLELSLNVQNLFDKQHIEFYDRNNYPIVSEIERAAYAKLLWEF